MHCCRIVNVIKNKNIKNSLGATWNASHLADGIVRFASLETSFHAAHHTVPPPPSYEGPPHCPKDKNRSPFHDEKPLIVK
ncbi:MAG: hypothetical protein MR758_07265 [Bacteroidales bacterium]|nr:hypothetical protein [Bacteroidales bacterium]